ncbi:hypothetical protein [Chryseobacterium sp. JAH]|uniref:hypothetical protein n=1 Tax=Chryseobacterium sp. JAH TaxID=1742858 RepID=UPI003977810E
MQAISLSEQRGNVSLVAQELGSCKESLINWIKLHKEGKAYEGKTNFLRSHKRRAFETSQGT